MPSQNRAVNNTVSSQWTNPNNAFVLDNACTSSGTSGQQNTYNFINNLFSLPVGAIIQGLQVTVFRASSDGDDKYNIELVDANLEYKLKNGNAGPTGTCVARTAETLGTVDDLWGGAWTREHINSVSFAVRLTQVKTGKQGLTYVDYIEVIIIYSIVTTGFRKLQYVSEPPSAGWNKLKYLSEPPVPNAWNKLAYEGE